MEIPDTKGISVKILHGKGSFVPNHKSNTSNSHYETVLHLRSFELTRIPFSKEMSAEVLCEKGSVTTWGHLGPTKAVGS